MERDSGVMLMFNSHRVISSCETSIWSDSFHEQLTEDRSFLKGERRLDTELVDKLILQLNRIHPQILTDKEATKVRVSLHMLVMVEPKSAAYLYYYWCINLKCNMRLYLEEVELDVITSYTAGLFNL